MKKHNSNMRIIAATSMTVFSLAAVFVATSAWFTASRKVDSNGDGFEVVSYDGLIKSVSAHMFKKIDDSGNYIFYASDDTSTTDKEVINYTVNEKTGQITSSVTDKISFGVYDTLMPEDAYAVMFLLEIDTNVAKNRSNGVKITPSTTTEESASLAHSENFRASGNPMSSIVDFFYGSAESSPSGDWSITKISSQQFLTFGSDSNTYNKTLDGTSYTSFDSIQYLQVVCEYNISNIESIYSLNLHNENLSMNDESNITYTQDWKITIA